MTTPTSFQDSAMTPKSIDTSMTTIPGPVYQNQFSISVDCESPGQTNNSMAVYKITINHFSIKKEPWFVLQHYSSFERLMKFLKENKACKTLLKQYNAKNLPKKPSVISFFSSLPDYVKGVSNFVAAIFSEKMFLNIKEVQIFFAIDKFSLNFVNASKHDQKKMQDEVMSSSGPAENISALTTDFSNNEITTNSKSSRNSTVSGWNLGSAWNRKSKPSDFEFLKVIGKGSFGKVLLAQHKLDNAFYAVKVLNKQTIIKKNEQGHIMAERNVLTKNLSHPFLVSLHYSFQTAEKLYFVLDYANGGELFFHLQKERVFSEPRARFYAAEIGSAIGYMHNQDILYRDLKPENLLLDRQGHVVLTDFGLCKEFITSNDTTQTFCGTPEYLAPEVLRKEPYSKAIDWWCYGSVLYEMLYGLPPFYSKDSQEMYRKILNQPLAFKSWASKPAKDILTHLLQKDPRKRMGTSIDDFQEIKAHHFFREIDWDKLLARKCNPPFDPKVKDAVDLSNIDRAFKEEALPASVINPASMIPGGKGAQEFANFTYVRPEYEDF